MNFLTISWTFIVQLLRKLLFGIHLVASSVGSTLFAAILHLRHHLPVALWLIMVLAISGASMMVLLSLWSPPLDRVVQTGWVTVAVSLCAVVWAILCREPMWSRVVILTVQTSASILVFAAVYFVGMKAEARGQIVEAANAIYLSVTMWVGIGGFDELKPPSNMPATVAAEGLLGYINLGIIMALVGEIVILKAQSTGQGQNDVNAAKQG